MAQAPAGGLTSVQWMGVSGTGSCSAKLCPVNRVGTGTRHKHLCLLLVKDLHAFYSAGNWLVLILSSFPLCKLRGAEANLQYCLFLHKLITLGRCMGYLRYGLTILTNVFWL